MNDLVIASRYASALFELAHPERVDAVVEAELLAFSEALKNSKHLYGFFQNPSFSDQDKEKVLRNLYKMNFSKAQDLLIRFFKLLLKKNRFYLIHDVAMTYKKIADEAQLEVMLLIRSAATLTTGAEQMIVSRMEKIAGAKVEIKKEVDPALLGGVVVRFRNKILDGSVKNKIKSFQKEFLKIQSFN